MLGGVIVVFGGCWAKGIAVVGVKHDHRNAACSIVQIGYGLGGVGWEDVHEGLALVQPPVLGVCGAEGRGDGSALVYLLSCNRIL